MLPHHPYHDIFTLSLLHQPSLLPHFSPLLRPSLQFTVRTSPSLTSPTVLHLPYSSHIYFLSTHFHYFPTPPFLSYFLTTSTLPLLSLTSLLPLPWHLYSFPPSPPFTSSSPPPPLHRPSLQFTFRTSPLLTSLTVLHFPYLSLLYLLSTHFHYFPTPPFLSYFLTTPTLTLISLTPILALPSHLHCSSPFTYPYCFFLVSPPVPIVRFNPFL